MSSQYNRVSSQSLTPDDAVYALVVHRYIVARWVDAQQVTELAAARIAVLAREMGLRPSSGIAALGFDIRGTAVGPLRKESVHAVLRMVRKHGRGAMVQALYTQFGHLSVGELEETARTAT